MDDMDPFEYYVVRKGKYDDMKAEIERLRVDNRRLHMKLMVAYSEEAGMYDAGKPGAITTADVTTTEQIQTPVTPPGARCPGCKGRGWIYYLDDPAWCTMCNGKGIDPN